MHLDGCEQQDEESKLSRNLIDQVFDLRISRILSGKYDASTSTRLTAGHCNCLRQYNSRYRALTTLKRRVWQKFRWATPNPNNAQGSVVEDAVDMGYPTDASVGLMPVHDHGPDGDSMSALWDDFAAAAPLEIPNWDDWESLTAGFFTDMN